MNTKQSSSRRALRGWAQDKPPERLGPYRILSTLGAGGMGVVYEAEQSSPQRRVALKVLRPGLVTPDLRRRFQRESRVLAQLHHPGIAHVYEAGSEEVGPQTWSYFAMELIAGTRIDEYVESQDLSVEARLTLFAKVCDAVHHAHKQGIVHRDLKPANVLVVEASTSDLDGGDGGWGYGPQPKVLDFGVARVRDAQSTHSSGQTQTGQIVGTIGYMSPEQLFGSSRDIDARADVYALGVLLYRLLTSKMPYDLADKGLAAAARILHEDAPTPIGHVNTSLRGDIEFIVSKALEKDPELRYASAADLAKDIRRHLAHKPILARRSSAGYRAAKFVRRHKAVAGALTVGFVALAVSLGLTTAAYFSVRQERDAKQEALQASMAATDFLSDMLAVAQPHETPHDMTVRELLDRAADGLDTRFVDQPRMEAKLRATLGRTYLRLGEYGSAEQALRRSVTLYRQGFGADAPPTLQAQVDLGQVLVAQKNYVDASSLLQEVILRAKEQYTPQDPRWLMPRMLFGAVATAEGRYDEAQSWLASAKALREARIDADAPSALELLGHTVDLALAKKAYEEAQPMLVEVIGRSRRVHGPEHPRTLRYEQIFACTLANLGQFEAAQSLLTQTVDKSRRVLGPNHAQTQKATEALARLQSRHAAHPTVTGTVATRG